MRIIMKVKFIMFKIWKKKYIFKDSKYISLDNYFLDKEIIKD